VEEAIMAASLIESKLDFVWYIIGNGPDYCSLADKVRALHLGDRIVFTGNLANPYPYLKYADLMVHPSQVESLCISVLEAMALETPCLVVHSIGPDSYIQDGKNGFLINKGPESIADGIISVKSKDHTCIESIRRQGFELVSGVFSPESVMSDFRRLLDE
jgi:glycosyltransferase involved in cell wall biosynthesis